MNGPGAAELPTFGGTMAYTFVSLGLVCLVAYLCVRWLARRGVSGPRGPLRVVARCSLEPRRSIYVVEAGSRRLLIGCAEGGVSLLTELEPGSDPITNPVAAVAQRRSFREVLGQLAGERAREEKL